MNGVKAVLGFLINGITFGTVAAMITKDLVLGHENPNLVSSIVNIFRHKK